MDSSCPADKCVYNKGMTTTQPTTEQTEMQNITVIYRPKSPTPRLVTITCPGSLAGQELTTYINIVLGSNWVLPIK